jgi:hypothetical protein
MDADAPVEQTAQGRFFESARQRERRAQVCPRDLAGRPAIL